MNFENFTLFTWVWITIGIFTFITLLNITAPYGRHSNTNWGPMINNRVGWIIMELFVLVVLGIFILTGKEKQTFVNWLIIGFFSLHYVNRSLIFPFRIKTNGKKMPIIIVFSALFFNLINGYIIGYYLGNFETYSIEWIKTPFFIIGTIIFFTGMFINWQSDTILINLRKPNETDYKIPKGGLFNLVSCPNLFGEIIEWAGFAILTWNLPGLAFFVWTFANLVPRAISHHKWYRKKFDEYPNNRKAIFPFLW
jgi:protein-S-isoprenylcysteine O-methyltransferase Ste14